MIANAISDNLIHACWLVFGDGINARRLAQYLARLAHMPREASSAFYRDAGVWRIIYSIIASSRLYSQGYAPMIAGVRHADIYQSRRR